MVSCAEVSRALHARHRHACSSHVCTPGLAFGAREGETSITPKDTDGNGKSDTYEVDWDGDGDIDEVWEDDDEDGAIDDVEVVNDGGDDSRSPRGKEGVTRVKVVPLSGGGAYDRHRLGWRWHYDEVWWDFDGDGTVDDTDIYETESKVLDNTKSTRFRGVFVGVKNGLDHPGEGRRRPHRRTRASRRFLGLGGHEQAQGWRSDAARHQRRHQCGESRLQAR